MAHQPEVATTRASDSRRRLLEAASELFAAEGSEAVSLRRINESAGARNASALQYHFGDRRGLVRAVIEQHQDEVEAGRHTLLDAYEAAGTGEIRGLAAALVRPFAPKLEPRSGGPGYLQVLSDLLTRPRPILPSEIAPASQSLLRWRDLLGEVLEPQALRLHRRFTAYQFTVSTLARRARSDPGAHHDLFLSHLIDLVTGLLTTPLSEETRHHLQEERL